MTFLCVLNVLFLFLDYFSNFFHRPTLIFNTLVFLSSFCCCLLFQLKIFLWACLLSSVFSSWWRKTYGFIFLGCKKTLCLLVASMPHAARSLRLFSFYADFPSKNKLVTWRMWFGFLRSTFRLSVPKFKYRASCWCLLRGFALVSLPSPPLDIRKIISDFQWLRQTSIV